MEKLSNHNDKGTAFLDFWLNRSNKIKKKKFEFYNQFYFPLLFFF
jgi:hypothetical protein